MTNQRDVVTTGETDAIFRVINDPVELFLEYRLIALDAPKGGPYPDQELYGAVSAELETRYCILIVSMDKYGGTETQFFYDVSRSYRIAKEILNLLGEGCVTPIAAKYILEDWL